LAELDNEGSQGDLNKLVRDMSRTETEVEFLKQKLVDIDRQAKLLDETQKDTIASLKALEKTYAEQGKQSESLE